MTDNPSNKTDLLLAIDQAWREISAALDRLSEAQSTTIRDAQGWTVKDHVMHMAAWERSMVYFLQGLPRHAGLGIDATLYLEGSVDAINAAIQQQSQDFTLAAVRAELRDTHQQMMLLLYPLTDADLHKPYRHYLPDEPGEGDGPPAINLIYGNTAEHFAEHLGWIQALAT
jgi:hypothetical protein